MNNQTLITVKDVAQSAAWYCDHLGLLRGHGGPDYEQLLDDNKLILQLHSLDADTNHEALLRPGETPGLGVVLWFSVPDFDQALERLRNLDTVFDKEPFMNPYAKQWEVWFYDPDGYRIVISGPSAYSIQPLNL